MTDTAPDETLRKITLIKTRLFRKRRLDWKNLGTKCAKPPKQRGLGTRQQCPNETVPRRPITNANWFLGSRTVNNKTLK